MYLLYAAFLCAFLFIGMGQARMETTFLYNNYYAAYVRFLHAFDCM